MVWDRGVLMIWGKTRRTIHKSMSIRICSGLAIFLFVFSDTPLVWRGLEYCLSQTRAYSCGSWGGAHYRVPRGETNALRTGSRVRGALKTHE